MPPEDWYCGWCGFGPLSFSNGVHCCRSGHRLGDSHSTVSSLPSNTSSHHHAGPNSQSEDPGAHSVSAVNTESVLSGAAAKREAPSPERSPGNLFPAKSVSSKDSKALVAVSSGTLGWAPDDVLTIQPLSKQKAASQGASEIRQDPSVNLSNDNGSQIGSADKRSRLNDYLSINAEDPWNHEWVAYGARTRLPGESSYLLKTGEPATTSRRRPYDAIRRVEVALTRNNGGACEPCKRRHQRVSDTSYRYTFENILMKELQCRHRLQELGLTKDDDGIASGQVMEAGVTRRATDAVRSDEAAGVESSARYGGAINSEYSAGDMLFAPIPRREPSQRPHGHRRTRAGPSGPFALAPSQRPQASLPSLVLGDEPGIKRGRTRDRIGANALGSRPARPSARHGRGTSVMSGSSGSSRRSNNAAIHGTSRDFAASTPAEETYSLGGTQRGIEEPPYMYAGAGLRSFSPLPYVQQQPPLSEQMFTTQGAETFDTAPSQGTSLSHGFLPWHEGSYVNLGGTQARFSNVADPPRSASRNHLDLVPAGGVNESSSPLFRPPETPFWPSEQASFGQEYFNEQAVPIPLPMRRSSRPQTRLNQELMSVPEVQQALPNWSDENFGWQIVNGPLLHADPPEQMFDTALLDELLLPSEQRADPHATHSSLAMENNLRPTGPYVSSDINLATDFAWDDAYLDRVIPSVDPPLGSYAADLRNPLSTVGNESTSGSNSDPIPTLPSDETG